MARHFALLTAGAVAAALLAAAPPAHALKVATWNVIDYPNNNPTGRAPALRTVMLALDPDVIVLQELKPAGRDSFLINVLGVAQPGQWSAGTYINTAESCVFYKPAKVTLTFAGGGIPTAGPRDVLGVRIKFPGYVSREAEMRIYSVHFNAGTTDSTSRRLECTDLRTNLNNVNTAVVTRHFLIGGDTNFYGTWEGGYVRLTESQLDNDGQSFDPLSLPGTWNQNAYRFYHTQSPCTSCPAGYSNGGLDDRFDLWLTGSSVQDGEGLDLATAAYVAYGNDGQHYNSAVNGGGFNNAVGITIANALHDASDHLPVMVTVQAPAKIAAASQLDFGRAIVGGTAQLTLDVSNPALSPADELTHSLAAPVGFSAPGGTFLALSGGPPLAHVIGMDTSTPGARAGTLTVSSDDPDSATKAVQLSGTVLEHAVSSLDSLVESRADTIDFGAHLVGGFTDQAVCVHNLGWHALQSKLRLTGAVFQGGAGRFSIVGGFTPSDLEGTGRCFTVHFDDAGATLDSTYQATLTFSSSDEPVPGGVPASDLVVVLRASAVSSPGAVDVPGGIPDRLAFRSPRPNPFRDRVELSFDLPRAARVTLDVYDPTGRRVARILDGVEPAGWRKLEWAARDASGRALGAGLYFVRFRADAFLVTRRLVVLP
jgi:hypothetical protein